MEDQNNMFGMLQNAYTVDLSKPNNLSNRHILEMHTLFLGALRQREQDIVRFLAILAPALGGFFYLLLKKQYMNDSTFLVGVVGVQGVLLAGACYSAALGYNYRYILMQIVKIEKSLRVEDVILRRWPRHFRALRHSLTLCTWHWLRRKVGNLAWCWPPEIIKVFWWSFVVALVLISIVTCLLTNNLATQIAVILSGFVSVVIVAATAHIYGRKLRKVCDAELRKRKTDCNH